MVGIIPSANSTYEVYGDFNSDNLIEGKLYYDPNNKRLYYYSKEVKRSNPKTGYFPVWDGASIYVSNFSNEKYFDKDVVTPDINSLAKMIDSTTAQSVIYKQRISDDGKLLSPIIADEDNMFTQIIKGIICKLKLCKMDLLEMSGGLLSERVIDNYYSALTKVTMMRTDKFHIWLDVILHCHYELSVMRDNKCLISYTWPENKFDTGIVKYNKIVNESDDPYKKIVKILMVMNNITKYTLKTDDVDDYTINNMMTIIHSDKKLSAQIFCRFIRMTGLSFALNVYKNDSLLFTYKE